MVKIAEFWGLSPYPFVRLRKGFFPQSSRNYSHILINFLSLSFYCNTNTFDSYIDKLQKYMKPIGVESKGQGWGARIILRFLAPPGEEIGEHF